MTPPDAPPQPPQMSRLEAAGEGMQSCGCMIMLAIAAIVLLAFLILVVIS